ncbi:MAG: DUF5107 domain-containing protein [Ignavibacteriales bacterium]|nr:DUF5107 domain-containing protein [Ignavibacteriales bacterium]
MIDVFVKDGLTNIVLQNEFIKIVVLPEIGGKMIELKNKITSTQFLLEPQNGKNKYERIEYGDDFSKFDISGFDECFPNISKSTIKLEDNVEVELPDHGELWSRPWNFRIEDDSIILSISGIKLCYQMEKRISINKNKIVIDYLLENTSKQNIPYLWSSHPLLKVEPGAKIILPSSVKDVFLNWASDKEIGNFGDIIPYPYLTNKRIDYSEVQNQGFGKAVKLFSSNLDNGYCALFLPAKNESLVFQFDEKVIPYLGIWLCYGGWPENAKKKHLTVALEPTSGFPDALDEAINRNTCQWLKPFAQNNWQLNMILVNGKSIFEDEEFSSTNSFSH